jgi:hypothetical protein
LTASSWAKPVRWTPDGLFYQAMAEEVGGDDAAAARADVFFGRYRGVASQMLGYRLNPTWIDFQGALMRRRWTVPVLAAALSPGLGDRSILVMSLVSYAALGPALFVLLRRRFATATSLIVALAAILLPPLSYWAGFALTDLPSLLLLTVALLAATVAVERGRLWIGAWALVMLLFGFTRESALIPVAAACWLAACTRTRRATAVALTGIAAVLPTSALFGVPLRTTLAFAFSGNDVPRDDSWGFVADRYWPYLRWMLDNDLPSRSRPAATIAIWLTVMLLFVRPHSTLWPRVRDLVLAAALSLFALLLVGSALGLVADSSIPTGLVLALGIIILVPIPLGSDPYLELMRGAGLASVGFILVVPQWSAFRYELVLIPAAAAGYAAALEAQLSAYRARQDPRRDSESDLVAEAGAVSGAAR